MKINWAKGFTLIELLIVIAILGVLAAGVVVAVNPLGKLNSANLAKAKTFSASVENALIMSQVGKWSFEEGSGNIVKDISGYGNDGTLNGGVTWKTSAECGLGFGGCLSFNGVNTTGGYVNCGTGASLNLGTADFTIEFWAKGRIHDAGAFIGKGTGTYSSITEGWIISYNYWSTTDQLFFHHTATANKVTWTGQRTYFTNNTWHHWAFVGNRAAGALGLYRDGVFISNKSPPGNFSTTNITSTNPLLIGAEGSSIYRYEGDMDEVRVYNQALLSFQVQQLYAQGLIKHLLAFK